MAPLQRIKIASGFVQKNLPFPQFSQRVSVSPLLFLVQHFTSQSFPARRCVPALLLASQALKFSPPPSLAFSFRCCVTLPVRFHCLVFTRNVLRNSRTPAFPKVFAREPPLSFIYLRGLSPPPLRRCCYICK